jgi:hypothetical protein
LSLSEEDRNFSVNDSKLIASSGVGSGGVFLNDIRFSIPIHTIHNSSWTIRLSNTLDDVRRMDEKKKEEEKEESPFSFILYDYCSNLAAILPIP